MTDDFARFDNRTALVTGSTSGIGAEIAREMTARGATVLAVNVRAPHVLVGELAPKMAEHGGTIVMIGSWRLRSAARSPRCTPRPRRRPSSWPAPGPPSSGRAGSGSPPWRPG